jgi:hypothetical protein
LSADVDMRTVEIERRAPPEQALAGHVVRPARRQPAVGRRQLAPAGYGDD